MSAKLGFYLADEAGRSLPGRDGLLSGWAIIDMDNGSLTLGVMDRWTRERPSLDLGDAPTSLRTRIIHELEERLEGRPVRAPFTSDPIMDALQLARTRYLAASPI